MPPIDESWGNYRSYYRRRRGADAVARSRPPLPPDRDERLQSLQCVIAWRGARVLDVGCNSGEVAVEIAQRLGARQVVGVDVDPALVRRCQTTLAKAASLMAPNWTRVGALGGSGPDAGSKKRKRSHEAAKLDHHFPSCFPDLFGSIDTRFADVATPIDDSATPPRKRKTKRREAVAIADSIALPAFPRHIDFHVADWTQDDAQDDDEPYDVILAFSLTKWIHLHHLDAGIIKLFQKCFDRLRNDGGRLVLEKQGWSGYRDAKRSNPTLAANYRQLALRPEADFERILLEQIGFKQKEVVKDDGGSGFDRSIEIYIK